MLCLALCWTVLSIETEAVSWLLETTIESLWSAKERID